MLSVPVLDSDVYVKGAGGGGGGGGGSSSKLSRNR